MKDFTLHQYKKYLQAIKQSYKDVLLFKEYLANPSSYVSFCLIRHDVDRKPKNALKMALLENDLGIKSTYYFRIKKNVFDVKIIQKIASLGHEIGYHYECLSDEKGHLEKSFENFKKGLNRFKGITEIKSISMHGRPLSNYDNRDMWRHSDALKELHDKYGILGEIYLHIDYSDIAYIGDTGRNWNSTRSNKRDQVDSTIEIDLDSGNELLSLLEAKAPQKLVFQIHPERWTNSTTEYYIQLAKDQVINFIKKFL